MPGDPGDPPPTRDKGGGKNISAVKVSVKRGSGRERTSGKSKELKLDAESGLVKDMVGENSANNSIFNAMLQANNNRESNIEMNNNNNESIASNAFPDGNATTDATPVSEVKKDKLYYDDSHGGPYMVYVDTLLKNNVRQPLNLVDLSRHVTFLEIKDVICVTKIGFGRGKIVFKNATAANVFVDDARIASAGYEPKILPHFLSNVY
ncbi:uncharacterized protein [Musca autumnalis]|uniref:uncharacterized protein n=1 Tax=Musca autumnalis TaxID=221902 RepID=UPI003CE79009